MAKRREPPATALARYARLEAVGDWWDGETARPREVIVKFGRSSLTLYGFDETPLAHWALAGLRRIDAPGEPGTLRLTPDVDGDERLVLRDPEMIEAIRAVCPDLDRAAPSNGSWRRVALWAAGALTSIALLVFVIVPALAERLAPMIPPERAAALGDAVLERIGPLMGGGEVCAAPAGRAALARMTLRLTEAAPLETPVKVSVWRSPTLNAFAVPGGRIVILSGLIDAAEGPEEVAAVLAHELGHVAARDPLRSALRRAGTAGLLGLFVGDFVGGAVVVATAEAAISAAYSREAETAADRYAHRLLGEAGLPASALAGFFESLADRGAGAEGFAKHFASHPDLEARAEAARSADHVGDGAYDPVLDDAGWIALQQICG
ncbi:MAG TPA: M48 family metallopeptidase [Paracoccaceae bacterium]|nr:M48 family metallopeptidase [Paracoccaceae bacterium]